MCTTVTSALTQYSKERVWLLCFLLYINRSKNKMCVVKSLADFQYSQTVKSHFAVQSSSQAIEVMVKIF